jgi:integrase/recombinase XerD
MNSLREGVKDYLALRRTLGFKLRDEGTCLMQFAVFAEQQGGSFVTADLALRWATQPAESHPAHWARRLRMVRIFARYQQARDPRTEIPDPMLLPHRYRRRPPYIYSDDEIRRLMGAAAGLPSPTGLRAVTYSALFGLLAATGMRISEPIALNCADVDLGRGLLNLRETKCGNSRLIPVHASTTRKLNEYARFRKSLLPRSHSPSFFVSEADARLTHWTVRWTFVGLSRQVGLRGKNDSHGPRLHDLRHTFAVNTLLGWYRAGLDAEVCMPRLAAYLGHSHIHDTYWYISAVPELLQLAAMRLDTIPRGLPS